MNEKKYATVRKKAEQRGEKIHFLAKMSFGRAYACKQTTPFVLLANFIRGEATKGSSISLPHRQNKKDRYKTCRKRMLREDTFPYGNELRSAYVSELPPP